MTKMLLVWWFPCSYDFFSFAFNLPPYCLVLDITLAIWVFFVWDDMCRIRYN